MDSATTTLPPAATTAKPRAFSYGWDRTPDSPDEFRDIRESGNLFDMPAPPDFTFHDLLQAINPLQHLPVISTIYRQMTGEKIHPLARVLGDTIFGGALGFASAVVNNVVEHFSGKDIGDNLLAMVSPSADTTPATTGLAAATPAASRTLGDRLAAVALPDRGGEPAADLAKAPARRRSLGETLAAVFLPDRDASVPAAMAAAPAPASAAGLGGKLAAVSLSDPTQPAAKGQPSLPVLAAAAPAAASAPLTIPAAPRNGRSLADYFARPVDAPSTTAAVRATLRAPSPALHQTPAALAAAPAAQKVEAAAPPAAPAEPAAASAAPAPGLLNDGAGNAWFAERMLMGLDLYRSSKRQSARAQVDRYE